MTTGVNAKRQQGTVVWFDDQKGFGFITPETGGLDLFVHCSDILDDFQTLEDGQVVEFVVGEGSKGRTAAKKVRPVRMAWKE